LEVTNTQLAEWILRGFSFREVHESRTAVIRRPRLQRARYEADVLGIALVGKLGDPCRAWRLFQFQRLAKRKTQKQLIVADLLGIAPARAANLSRIHAHGASARWIEHQLRTQGRLGFIPIPALLDVRGQSSVSL